ncbi:MAG: MFS transporter [Desulfuromonadales bacterium]
MAVALLTTILALSALYAPQPLLPAIAREFGVSREMAAFLITISFIPLSLAPLAYGYLLESLAPRRLLRIAVLLLASSEVLFFFGGSFPVLVGLRLFQGLLIPAMLTALMTYISRAARGVEVQRGIAAYIAATILGGFLGRAGSGAIATVLNWRFSFLLLALSLLVCYFLLGRLAENTPTELVKPTPRAIIEVLALPLNRKLFLTIFCLFLVFAAIMNFIPFRLIEISDRASDLRIGLMYSGYVMGIVTSLNAVRIARLLGGEVKTMLLGLLLYVLALLGMTGERPAVLFAIMFVFCGAMFLVHSTASGLLNRYASGRKGIVNGLYIAFYYAGGVIGSFFPGYVYRSYGWTFFILTLIAVALCALVLIYSARRQAADLIMTK